MSVGHLHTLYTFTHHGSHEATCLSGCFSVTVSILDRLTAQFVEGNHLKRNLEFSKSFFLLVVLFVIIFLIYLPYCD